MNVTFTIENKEYEVNDITVGDWYKIKDYMLLDGHEASFKAVSELSGCPIEKLKMLRTHEWLQLWEAVETYVVNANVGKLEKQMKIGDTIYGLVNMDELTIGEFADMDVLMNDPAKESKLHQMLAILYRPIIEGGSKYHSVEAYDPIKCTRRAEDFLQANLSACLGLVTFFLDFARASYDLTVDSLRVAISRMETDGQNAEELKQTLQRLTSLLPEVGTDASSVLQGLTLSNLIVLRNSLSTRHSTGSPGTRTDKSEN